MPDKTLTCKECNNPFTLSESEQAFFSRMGFQEPKRCKGCRQQRKTQRPNNQPQENHGPEQQRVEWTNGDGAERRDRRRRSRGTRRDDFAHDDE
jgi:hypothetical protein